MHTGTFIEPDRDFILTESVMMLLLEGVANTKRKKKILTIDRIQIFYFLISHPRILASAIAHSGEAIALSDAELLVIEPSGLSPDAYIPFKRIKLILAHLGSRALLKLTYSDTDGFLYELNGGGVREAENLKSTYFSKVRKYVGALSSLIPLSIPQLNERIKLAAKENKYGT